MELLGGNGVALAVGLGDLPVLTEEAVAGAARKKDGAGAARAAEAGLLAHVRAPGGDAQRGGLAADAGSAAEPVDGALPGAEAAGGVGREIHLMRIEGVSPCVERRNGRPQGTPNERSFGSDGLLWLRPWARGSDQSTTPNHELNEWGRGGGRGAMSISNTP